MGSAAPLRGRERVGSLSALTTGERSDAVREIRRRAESDGPTRSTVVANMQLVPLPHVGIIGDTSLSLMVAVSRFNAITGVLGLLLIAVGVVRWRRSSGATRTNGSSGTDEPS